MTNNEQKQNLDSRFISFLSNTVHAWEIAPRQQNKDAALDQSFLRANVFYSKVLLDVCLGMAPRRGEFDNSGFEEGDDAVYQGALYLYHLWKKMPREQAIRNYCQYVNGLLPPSLMTRGGKEYYATQRLSTREQEIMEALC